MGDGNGRRIRTGAEMTLCLLGVLLAVSPFLPWTTSPDGQVSGWWLTSHFGPVWSFSSEGWIDATWWMTTGVITFFAGLAVAATAGLDLADRESWAGSSVAAWLVGACALVIGVNPLLALRVAISPAEDALAGVWLAAIAGVAVPLVLGIELVGRAITRHGSSRPSASARLLGIALLVVSAFVAIAAMQALGDTDLLDHRTKAATEAVIALLLAIPGVVLVLVNRSRRHAPRRSSGSPA